MVEFNNVSKVYQNGTVALQNVDLYIENGEFVFIVGLSGSGKTSLIKLLLKEEEATEGEVFINGQNLSELTHDRIPYLRREIGIVFQDFRLLKRKTVYDNVAFAMEEIGRAHV